MTTKKALPPIANVLEIDAENGVFTVRYEDSVGSQDVAAFEIVDALTVRLKVGQPRKRPWKNIKVATRPLAYYNQLLKKAPKKESA